MGKLRRSKRDTSRVTQKIAEVPSVRDLLTTSMYHPRVVTTGCILPKVHGRLYLRSQTIEHNLHYTVYAVVAPSGGVGSSFIECSPRVRTMSMTLRQNID